MSAAMDNLAQATEDLRAATAQKEAAEMRLQGAALNVRTATEKYCDALVAFEKALKEYRDSSNAPR